MERRRRILKLVVVKMCFKTKKFGKEICSFVFAVWFKLLVSQILISIIISFSISLNFYSVLLFVELFLMEKKEIDELKSKIASYENDLANASTPQEKSELRNLIKSRADNLDKLLAQQLPSSSSSSSESIFFIMK